MVPSSVSRPLIPGPRSPFPSHGTYWTIQDRQNSIRDAVGGDLIIYNWHSTSYTDYGAAVAVSGRTFNNTLPSYFHYAFAGQQRETTTVFVGMNFCEARWIDTKTGGFISQDPISFASGQTNLYVYCHNDPINFIDPTGLWGADVHHNKTLEWGKNILSKQAMEAIASYDEGTDSTIITEGVREFIGYPKSI